MVFIVGASSLYHALETLKPQRGVQNFPEIELKDKTEVTEIGIGQDFLKKSSSKLVSNSNRPISTTELLEELNFCGHCPRAQVFCQRDRTLDIFEFLEQKHFLT